MINATFQRVQMLNIKCRESTFWCDLFDTLKILMGYYNLYLNGYFDLITESVLTPIESS